MANYNAQDINSVLYSSSTITSDGNSSVIDFGVNGGCPASEIVLNVSDVEAGESIVFSIYNYTGSYVDTGYKLTVSANGVYTWPIDNRIVTGSKLRLAHDITLSTSTLDGIFVHGHVRPRSL